MGESRLFYNNIEGLGIRVDTSPFIPVDLRFGSRILGFRPDAFVWFSPGDGRVEVLCSGSEIEDIPMSTHTELYDQDFYAWTQHQTALLRAQKYHDLDYENLAEEVESLGKSQQNALESCLEKLLLHLLKWRYQPDKRVRGHSWEDTIREQRRRLSRLLSQNPSLCPTVLIVLAESYPYVRQRTSLQTRLPLATFPATCPWTVAQLLDDDFWPEGAPTS
jgi:hypothetical protein